MGEAGAAEGVAAADGPDGSEAGGVAGVAGAHADAASTTAASQGVRATTRPTRAVYCGGVPDPPNQPAFDPFDPAYVGGLFDAMSATYDRVNVVTSFGFSRRWRRQAVERLDPRPGDTVVDGMTGMGEGWRHLLPRIGPDGRVVAVDLSAGMLRGAMSERDRLGARNVELVHGDALAVPLPDGSADALLCLFGVKTLAPGQRARFAGEVARLLRPGGRFSIVEVSAPSSRLVRVPYLAYLGLVVPLVGRLFLGNPETYRMLARYTRAFGDARALAPAFSGAGLEVERYSMLLGCATGLAGHKPLPIDSAHVDQHA